jgi:hypothetical protein
MRAIGVFLSAALLLASEAAVPETTRQFESLDDRFSKLPVDTKKQLQVELDDFARYYNDIRPHRGISRQTLAVAFAAREKTGLRGMAARRDRSQ